jgi:RNA polymerase subunit RPABC4/transcription elongation factor Spt4
MHTASIVVDLRHLRCSNCKVALHDELTESCPACGAAFDSITSNHVGLAEKLEQRRKLAQAHETVQ